MHPRSRYRHLLDYVLVQRRDQQDVLVTKAIQGADGWIDHRLFISKVRFRQQPPAAARDAGRLNGSQGQGDSRGRGPQRKDELLLSEQGFLRADSSALLTEKTQILQRWAEHFQGVLNSPSTIYDAATVRLPQVETNGNLDHPLSLHETIKAVQQFSRDKASGSDATPAEIYRYGCAQLMDHLTALSREMLREGEVPQGFKDATIVHLYKRKGLLSGSQFGFRRHRGTTDMIFGAGQLQKKCQDVRIRLYSAFVDLTKAFDTVNNEKLWEIMQKFGCPEQFSQMVRQLHDDMIARVTDNGTVSEALTVTKFGLIISTEKTVVMHQPPPNTAPHNAQQIRVNGTQLQVLDNFTYLGSTLSSSTKIDDDVSRRIAKSSQAFDQPGELGRPHPGPPYVEENSEDRRSNLRSQPHHRRQSQLWDMQISPAATPHDANTQSPLTRPRCQRTFRAPSGLVGHLRINCSTQTAPTVLSPPTSSSPPLASTNVVRSLEPPPLPSSSSSSSSTSATVESAMPINTTHNPDTPANTNIVTVNTSDEDLVYTYPHCDRIFTSHIGLIGHLRIRRTATGGPVARAPTHSPHLPSLSTLPSHMHAQYGPIRPHVYPRERNGRQPRHT
nr:unnamed protein product [Spirometra erinaceieuropaei]